jgi:hypothetical protein
MSGCRVPSPLRRVKSATGLNIPTAGEFKTVVVYLKGNPAIPHKVIKMTSEPCPMTSLGIGREFFLIHDVEEHIDGGFSVFVSRSAE